MITAVFDGCQVRLSVRGQSPTDLYRVPTVGKALQGDVERGMWPCPSNTDLHGAQRWEEL